MHGWHDGRRSGGPFSSLSGLGDISQRHGRQGWSNGTVTPAVLLPLELLGVGYMQASWRAHESGHLILDGALVRSLRPHSVMLRSSERLERGSGSYSGSGLGL